MWQPVLFNGVEIDLPDYTLSTMTHCFHGKNEAGREVVLVETQHSDIMRDWLSEGDATFLDIGAATGAMTVPFAKELSDTVIYAFEPHRAVREILISTLIRNELSNACVLDFALSSETGTAEFFEQDEDPSGKVPYLPETSSLVPSDKAKQSYPVRTVRLDDLMPSLRLRPNTVLKVDIEGLEVEMLKGALELIGKFRPRMAIDIHMLPDQSGMADEPVKALLSPFGYAFEKLNHVLLCR